jgi:hypothetical protein
VVTHGGGIGRLEHHLGVHPGVPLPRLSGRWFDVDSVLPVSDSSIRAVGDRLDLLAL